MNIFIYYINKDITRIFKLDIYFTLFIFLFFNLNSFNSRKYIKYTTIISNIYFIFYRLF